MGYSLHRAWKRRRAGCSHRSWEGHCLGALVPCRAVPGEVHVAPPAWGGAERGGRTKPGCQRGGREKGKAAAAEQVRRATGVVPRWHREWHTRGEAVPRVGGIAGRGRLCAPWANGSPRGRSVHPWAARGVATSGGGRTALPDAAIASGRGSESSLGRERSGYCSLLVKKEVKF